MYVTDMYFRLLLLWFTFLYAFSLIFLSPCSFFFSYSHAFVRVLGYSAYCVPILWQKCMSLRPPLLGCYAVLGGSWLLIFRDKLSVPSSRVKDFKKNECWRSDRYVVPKRRWRTTSLRHVTSRKIEDPRNTAAGAWNFVYVLLSYAY